MQRYGPHPPWRICSVTISEQRWKPQGREVPLRGAKREGRVRLTGCQGISREKKSEVLSFPFGLPPSSLACLLSPGCLFGKRKVRPDFTKDRWDFPSFSWSFPFQLLLSAGVFLARCWVPRWRSHFHHQAPRPRADVTGW